MPIRIVLLLILITWNGFISVVHAQPTTFLNNSKHHISNQVLDSTATISLLTCAPGSEVYSTFGHSAIWIYDTVNNIDKIYNYGTFAFEDNFIYKFVKGDLDYYLSLDNSRSFIAAYTYEQREITQQELNLSYEEKVALYEFLIHNYLPENRTYRYDFLFDNCSTRIWEAINKATKNRITYDYSFIRHSDSYRELIADKASRLQWLVFGMDLMLGIPCDKQASNEDHMFLPDNMMSAYFFATIAHYTIDEPLVKRTSILLDMPPHTEHTSFYTSPIFVFSLCMLLIVACSLWEIKKGKWFKIVDASILFILFIIGCLFVFMWTSTRHQVAYMNMGLLFASPLLIIPFLAICLKKYRIVRYSMILNISLLAYLLISFHWACPQQFNKAMIPIFIILLIRSIIMYIQSKRYELAITKN